MSVTMSQTLSGGPEAAGALNIRRAQPSSYIDIQQQHRPRLEPIQEESEREDEIKGSETGEGEEEEEEEETMEVMAEDESENDEDAPLRVLRPRRMSRSLSQESFLRIQSTDNNREETVTFSESDQNTRTVGVSEESTPPQQTRLGNEKRSIRGKLKIKVSKWKRNTTAEPPVQKKKNSKAKKESLTEKPFPRWLVNLMVNIEEATTHQLVVE
ncbi:hypothetical protein VZT92_004409 [Zoarces viviparus]|uniref:Uncharacterized protein n=1 Tax=Zoarces viviparus TaxID=48416 RepID=A0AAW1FXJ3_ZOAVI